VCCRPALQLDPDHRQANAGLWMGLAKARSGLGRHLLAGVNVAALMLVHIFVCMCICACVCAYVIMHFCVCAYVRVCFLPPSPSYHLICLSKGLEAGSDRNILLHRVAQNCTPYISTPYVYTAVREI